MSELEVYANQVASHVQATAQEQGWSRQNAYQCGQLAKSSALYNSAAWGRLEMVNINVDVGKMLEGKAHQGHIFHAYKVAACDGTDTDHRTICGNGLHRDFCARIDTLQASASEEDRQWSAYMQSFRCDMDDSAASAATFTSMYGADLWNTALRLSRIQEAREALHQRLSVEVIGRSRRVYTERSEALGYSLPSSIRQAYPDQVEIATFVNEQGMLPEGWTMQADGSVVYQRVDGRWEVIPNHA